VVPPDVIEGMPASTRPYGHPERVLSSGSTGSAAGWLGTLEAVPGVPAQAAAAGTLGGDMAGHEVPVVNREKLMVNIYVVGIARLTECARDEHTYSVNDGCVTLCLARATSAVHSAWQLIG
jgi:hypothetical protein